MALSINNEVDVPRYRASIDEADATQSAVDGIDTALYEDELRLGELIEPLGFDSVFAYEHHFSPYIIHPDPLQFLAYWAGRTERIGVGTMLIIVPWHQPMRLAEQLVQLQHLLRGRPMKIGLGRGLSVREYAGNDVPMSESRERFDEAVRLIQMAIANETIDFQGKFYNAPDVSQRKGAMSLRPRPRDAAALLDSLYGGWTSPSSASRMAELDLRPMLIPSKVYDEYVTDLKAYASGRAARGAKPANPIATNTFCFCASSEREKDEIQRHIDTVGTDSFDVNYEMSKNYHAGVPGYEFYGELAKKMAEAAQSGGAVEAAAGAQPVLIGTPDDIVAEVQGLTTLLRPESWVFTFRRYNVPVDLCERSMKLFAKEVLPLIHELPVGEPHA